MRSRIRRAACLIAMLLALSSLGTAQEKKVQAFTGTFNDYAQALGTTWQITGEWSLEADEKSGTGRFSAALSMINTANLAGTPHTHHVSLSDAEIVPDPGGNGFTLSGDADITGNGNAALFSGSPIEVVISGGDAIAYSNLRLTFVGEPASGTAPEHFGTQPLAGVVSTHH